MKTVNLMLRISVLWLLLFSPGVVLAQNFGGPDAPDNLIEDDARSKPATITKRATQGWFDWKKKVQDEHGFSIGVDYTALSLTSS